MGGVWLWVEVGTLSTLFKVDLENVIFFLEKLTPPPPHPPPLLCTFHLAHLVVLLSNLHLLQLSLGGGRGEDEWRRLS